MNYKLSKNLHWPLILLLLILLVVMSFLSEGFYGGADNLTHYYISRYSFSYPELFLNTWGRPVFNIMSSPFSQFGFMGLKLFNVLLACLTAFLAFLTARKIGITKAWLAIAFVILTPMYFLMTLTGLTEIQFGFILILSVYLFFDEKYIASAIIISFLPLSRSEGIVLLPFFFFALLMKRKYMVIPFLATGILFFSILGYFFIYHDFFWLFTHSPYPLHHSVYKEKGPLLHFINWSPEIFGLPLLILFITGLGIYIYLFLTAEKKHRLQVFLEIWLLAFPVLLFFAVHSILYWKALFGSMGLIRVITGVLPLAAIVCLKAYDYLEKKYLKKEMSRSVFLFVIVLFLIKANFSINKYPVTFSPPEKAIKSATEWIKHSPFVKRKILFTHYYVPYLLGLDRYDLKQCEQVYSPNWLSNYPDGTVFIWDSYFGTNECNVPLTFIEKSGVFRLVNIFRPKYDKNSWGDPTYEIRIFIKVPPGSHFNNNAILDSIDAADREPFSVHFITGTTFESDQQRKDTTHIRGEFARSGSFSYRVYGSEQYALGFKLDLSKVITGTKNVSIRVNCFVYPPDPFEENDTRLIINHIRKSGFYHSLSLDSVARQQNAWNKVTFLATFPSMNPSDSLIVFFWHIGKKEFYVDDIKIESVYLKTNRQ
jgi:ABC-type cobalt transport system substrate-binding protein